MDNTAVISDPKMILNEIVLGGWRQRAHTLPTSPVCGQLSHDDAHENKIAPITVMGGYAADDFGTPTGSRPGRPPV